MRLTLHPAHYVQLNSSDATQVARAHQELLAAGRLLDALGTGREAVIVVHVGSARGDAAAGRERFVASLEQLPSPVRSRLAVENDDRAYSLADLLWIHRRTGLRLVFDALHHRCLDPAHMPVVDALAAALATWPADEQPKIHFSSPRTELRRDPAAGRLVAPPPNQHSDFIHPWEFIDLLAGAIGRGLRPFDIMLEAKAKELAVMQLRRQMAVYAPDIAALLR
jgi:UV DNA damage endonuclease